MAGSASINGIGNVQDNILLGNSGNNALYGLDGGADVMAGGTGSDAYVVDSLDDIVFEQVGQGNDTVYTELSYTLGANVENLQLAGAVDGTGKELNYVGTALDRFVQTRSPYEASASRYYKHSFRISNRIFTSSFHPLSGRSLNGSWYPSNSSCNSRKSKEKCPLTKRMATVINVTQGKAQQE